MTNDPPPAHVGSVSKNQMHPLARHLLRVLALAAVAALPLAASDPEAASKPVDRVGLPSDYAQSLEQIRHAYSSKRDKVVTAFANPAAASVKTLEQTPYPAGSVIVFEWADPEKDAEGNVRQDAAGRYPKGPVTRIDVMRREVGYGADYGEDRAGEWEFASYLPDGSAMELPEGAAACARCHRNAGVERDFVFVGRFSSSD